MNADSTTHPSALPDDPFAARLRAFGPTGLTAIAVVLAGNFLFAPLSALLALARAQRSRTPFAALGFAPLRHPVTTIVAAIVLGAAFKLLMKAIVMPALGAPPINAAYHFIAGNPAALPGMIFTIVVAAGFGEEVVFRGYFFERLGALLGRSTAAQAAIVVLTAALFGLAHAPEQGLPGVQQRAWSDSCSARSTRGRGGSCRSWSPTRRSTSSRSPSSTSSGRKPSPARCSADASRPHSTGPRLRPRATGR